MLAAFASLIVQVNASTATRVVKLLRVMIPLVGFLLPVLVLLAVTAATFAIWHWRAEYGRIFDILEKKGLNWPHVGHHTSGDNYRAVTTDHGCSWLHAGRDLHPNPIMECVIRLSAAGVHGTSCRSCVSTIDTSQVMIRSGVLIRGWVYKINWGQRWL
jgi:hypothetical protein